MKIIKRLFCKQCKTIANYKEHLQKAEKYSNDYLEKIRAIELLISFNNSKENIVFIKNLNDDLDNEYFIVTCEEKYDHLNFIKEINFYGYILSSENKIPDRVITLTTETLLNYNPIAEKTVVESIHIIDFIATSKNCGFGTCIMNCFLKYIKSLNIKKITGKLSFVDEIDENNKSLRNHFYKKFNFKFLSDDRIELDIQ